MKEKESENKPLFDNKERAGEIRFSPKILKLYVAKEKKD